MSELSNKLLALIIEQNRSYGELSRETGIPKSAIQRYATGETEKVPIDRIKILAKALKTTPASLLGWPRELDSLDEIVYSLYPDFVPGKNYLPTINKEKLAPNGNELDAETIELREIWDASDADERQTLLEMARLIKKRRNK